MIVNETKKYIIFHIPKNGGTTVHNSVFPKNDKVKKLWKLPSKTTPDLAHLHFGQLSFANLDDDIRSYKYYAIIRNPFERFLSGYNYASHHMPMFAHYVKSNNLKTMEDFIDHVQSCPEVLKKVELTWLWPQHLYCEHDDIRARLIRLENLKNDMETYFNIKIDKVMNKSNKNHERTLSDEYMLKLRGIYKRDFEIYES